MADDCAEWPLTWRSVQVNRNESALLGAHVERDRKSVGAQRRPARLDDLLEVGATMLDDAAGLGDVVPWRRARDRRALITKPSERAGELKLGVAAVHALLEIHELRERFEVTPPPSKARRNRSITCCTTRSRSGYGQRRRPPRRRRCSSARSRRGLGGFLAELLGPLALVLRAPRTLGGLGFEVGGVLLHPSRSSASTCAWSPRCISFGWGCAVVRHGRVRARPFRCVLALRVRDVWRASGQIATSSSARPTGFHTSVITARPVDAPARRPGRTASEHGLKSRTSGGPVPESSRVIVCPRRPRPDRHRPRPST